MKNIKHNIDNSLRPEYKRSDFGEMVQGKYASAEVELSELVGLFLSCIGEDEGVKITRRSAEDQIVNYKPGDWTYEIDDNSQITLRYWCDELNNIEETISSPSSTTALQDRAELQNLLIQSVRKLKKRAANTP